MRLFPQIGHLIPKRTTCETPRKNLTFQDLHITCPIDFAMHLGSKIGVDGVRLTCACFLRLLLDMAIILGIYVKFQGRGGRKFNGPLSQVCKSGKMSFVKGNPPQHSPYHLISLIFLMEKNRLNHHLKGQFSKHQFLESQSNTGCAFAVGKGF